MRKMNLLGQQKNQRHAHGEKKMVASEQKRIWASALWLMMGPPRLVGSVPTEPTLNLLFFAEV